MKAMKSERRENVQGTNNDNKETRTQINGFDHKKKINIHPKQNEEIRIQKSEDTLINSQDNLKCANIWIIGVPEGEEEDQEIGNLLEQIKEENFLNLEKEIDFQEVQEAQRVPKEVGPKEEHTNTHHR